VFWSELSSVKSDFNIIWTWNNNKIPPHYDSCLFSSPRVIVINFGSYKFGLVIGHIHFALIGWQDQKGNHSICMPVQSIPIIFQVSILFDPLIIGKCNLLLASLEPVSIFICTCSFISMVKLLYTHSVQLFTFSSVVVIKLLYTYSVQSHFFLLLITLQSQFGAASICSCLHGSMDDIAVVVHAFNVY